MPLLDHFHPPLSLRRHWESFHATWASAIMAHLNHKVLPKRCFAEIRVHVGGRVGSEVSSFEVDEMPLYAFENGPAVATSIPAIFPDEVEIQMLDTQASNDLVGAIELVSPGNKDRDEAIDSFVAKCVTYLRHGIGLLVVDIVTKRLANMHVDLMRQLNQPEASGLLRDATLYAVSYRPHRTKSADVIDIWPMPLPLGQSLPTMPLGLRRLPTIPVDLETTYKTTCEASRL